MAVDGEGWAPVAFSEIEAFPSAVLAHHWPDVPNLGDFTAIDPAALGPVNWLVGGTPCQSFSVAGLRGGLDDDRGNLTMEYVKLVRRLQDANGLDGFLWENVPGVLSDTGNAFGCFLGALVGHDGPLLPGDKPRYGRSSDTWRWIKPGRVAILDEEGNETGEWEGVTEGHHRPKWPDAGMVAGPRARLAWRILDSQYFGVAQRRRRVFVVGDTSGRVDPAAVLFEPKSLSGHSAPRREAGQRPVGTLAARPTCGGGLGTDTELDGGLVPSVANPLTARMAKGVNTTMDEGQTMVAHALRADGFDASEDGTCRGTPLVVGTLAASGGRAVPGTSAQDAGAGYLVPFDTTQITSKANGSNPAPGDPVHPLASSAHAPAIAFSAKDHGADAGDISPTIRAGGHDKSHANGGVGPAIAFDLRGREDGAQFEGPHDTANIRAADGGSSRSYVATHAVRRLTPVECERLQGFPDNHTQIPGMTGWRDVDDNEDVAELEAMGLEVRRTAKSNRLRVNDPDGPRYRALGNSFTVNTVRWIARRISASLAGQPMPPPQ